MGLIVSCIQWLTALFRGSRQEQSLVEDPLIGNQLEEQPAPNLLNQKEPQPEPIKPADSPLEKPPAPIVTESQTITVREDRISFVPKIDEEWCNGRLEEDPTKLIAKVLRLTSSEETKPAVLQTIFESYERSTKAINQEQSTKVEASLQSKKSKWVDSSPVFLLGKALEASTGAKMSFSQHQTAASQFTMLHLTTKFGDSWNKGQYVYPDDQEYSYKSVTSDSSKLKGFLTQFKEDMAQYYNTTPDRIIVQEIVKGSVNVKFYYSPGVPDGQIIMSSSTKRHLKGRLIKQEALFNQLQLSEEDFDRRGDIDFVQGHAAQEQKRGFFPYYQPAGWIRYGLNISKYAESDKIWLAMDGNPGQWAVMYHGVRSPTMMVNNEKYASSTTVAKAIVDVKFKAGAGQAYAEAAPIITESHKLAFNHYATPDHERNDPKVGVGIYCSPLIQTAQGYSGAGFNVNGENYLFAFQCRVRPDKIRISSGQKDYWVIRDANFIRPYGILITKASIVRDVKYQTLLNQFQSSYSDWIGREGRNP